MNWEVKFERVIIALLMIFAILAVIISFNIYKANLRREHMKIVAVICTDIENIDFTNCSDQNQLKTCAHELSLLYRSCLFSTYDVQIEELLKLYKHNKRIIYSHKHNKQIINILWENLEATNNKVRKLSRNHSIKLVEELDKL